MNYNIFMINKSRLQKMSLAICLTRIFFVLAVFMVTTVRAEPWDTFLVSTVYGTGFGALAGLTALAVSDQPTQNLPYVARGASLGLYIGMGVGAYLAHESSKNIERRQQQYPVLSFVPQPTQKGYESAVQVNYALSVP